MDKNIFLDTEFSKLSWEQGSHLLSVGLFSEDEKSYYACLNDIDLDDTSDFVKQNVLPYIEPTCNRKSRSSIRAEIESIFDETYQFWAVFPSREWLMKIGVAVENVAEIYEKYCDWDFQLFKEIWDRGDFPSRFSAKCNNLTLFIEKVPDRMKPRNESIHNALSDAKWDFEMWRISKSLSKHP